MGWDSGAYVQAPTRVFSCSTFSCSHMDISWVKGSPLLRAIRFNNARSKGSNRTETGCRGGRYATKRSAFSISLDASSGFSREIEESHVLASLFSFFLIFVGFFFIF